MSEDEKSPDAGQANGKEFAVSETINVPDRDLSPSEMAVIMRKVARVCNFAAGNLMRHAALLNQETIVGAGHPIIQAILNCAAQADSARAALEGPAKVMRPGQPMPVPRGRA